MKLADYLDATNTSVEAFGNTIGVDGRVTVRRYLSGDRIPNKAVMSRIISATRGAVQPNDFFPTAQTV